MNITYRKVDPRTLVVYGDILTGVLYKEECKYMFPHEHGVYIISFLKGDIVLINDNVTDLDPSEYFTFFVKNNEDHLNLQIPKSTKKSNVSQW